MQTVPGLVLCEKSEGTLIVFQQDAAGAQDIAHGGIVQVQLQQGADALQPVHQRIAVDEKLPGSRSRKAVSVCMNHPSGHSWASRAC